MSHQKFLLVSLPTSISPSNDRDEALTALRSTVTTDFGTTTPFTVPAFKIGTLDALVQQADDLSKLEAGCASVVGKVADSLRGILEGDEEKIAEQKNVNDREALQNQETQYTIAHRNTQALSRTIFSLFNGTKSSTEPISPYQNW